MKEFETCSAFLKKNNVEKCEMAKILYQNIYYVKSLILNEKNI